MTAIKEMVTRWQRPRDRMLFNRDRETLVGSIQDSPADTRKFRPFDMIGEPNQSILLWQNVDMRIGVESVVGTQAMFRRNTDYDQMLFQFVGATTLQTERGVFELGPGEAVVVPAGIAYRSIGSDGCQRLFMEVQEPLEVLLNDEDTVSHTRFEMHRAGGPSWEPDDARSDASGDDHVQEWVSGWHDEVGSRVVAERSLSQLVGAALEGGRPMSPLRVFDVFKSMTGQTGKNAGPGPLIYKSPLAEVEVYNTEGEQFAFHRGLDNDELWLQFRGNSTNESEFGTYELGPGEMNHIAPGIAHRVIGGEGFLRFVIYSSRPWALMVDPEQHAFCSQIDPVEDVIVPAAWKSAETE